MSAFPCLIKVLSMASFGKCSLSLSSDGPMPWRPRGWQVLQLRMKTCSPVRLVEREASFCFSISDTALIRLTSSDIEHAEITRGNALTRRMKPGKEVRAGE